MNFKTIMLCISSAMLVNGCSSNPTVTYVNPNTVDTTSIGFNSTDLQTTAKSMVDQMLSFPPIIQLTQNSTPVLFVDTLTNSTSDFIDTQAITDTITTELIQSGKFQFVDMTKVNTIKNQLNYQNKSGMVNPATAAKLGQQIGAQYMLYGDIASINAMNSNQQSLYYQITMKLLNVQTGIIVWQGQQQIRKVAQRSTFGW
jgi:uncharacterized protein (TIGR02722 family)